MPDSSSPLVAYFCAEFGLQSDLPIYAGGLGVLAGDTLRAAADLQMQMVGIGLLYRGEAAQQTITADGKQIEADMAFDPLSVGLEHVYLDDQPLFVKVHLTQLDIWVRVWKKTIGPTVTLYLLDTDTDQNQLTERAISQELYCGTQEAQLKQQLILGIGGVKLLTALGIHPTVYHLNEGRPSFLHWQLIRWFMDRHGMSFAQAHEQARLRTVYTNHTLVAAGNPSVPTGLLTSYSQYYADKMGIAVEELLAPGIEQDPEQFMITRFALNLSRKASGVSQLHTKLSQEAWPEYDWVNITNGVHLPTWQAPAIKEAALSRDPGQIWQAHMQGKRALAEFVGARTGYSYNPDHLVISWARRIAGYKRLDSLFTDIERLRSILKRSDRPVQLLVAGKAHHLDQQGKVMLQQIIHYFQRELAGNALFIPNYNLDVAKMMVQGSDVWLNTPEIGKEACGTSGMKAIANGVLQCTVADGWAAEVNWTDMGWVLDSSEVSEQFYQTLEDQIIPWYYERDQHGVPQKWVSWMQKSMVLSEQYSAERMVRQYEELLYS